MIDDGKAAGKRTAMIVDLSPEGALLFVRGTSYAVGEEVRLELHILIDSTPRAARGKVMRFEPLPDSRASFWTDQVAVELFETLELSDEERAAIAKRTEP